MPDEASRVQLVLDDILAQRNRGLMTLLHPEKYVWVNDADPEQSKALHFTSGVSDILRSTGVLSPDLPDYDSAKTISFSINFWKPTLPRHPLFDITLSVDMSATRVYKKCEQVSRDFDLHSSVQDRHDLVVFLFERFKESRQKMEASFRRRKQRRALGNKTSNAYNGVQKSNAADHRMRQALKSGSKESLLARYRKVNGGNTATVKDHKPAKPSPLGLSNINISSQESMVERKADKTVDGED